ncbi:MAG: hypothetical protein HYY17_06345 [Planctomycetes bacterium]|nr:hypothetical protein [Planctomycetota bacterium]
MSRTSETLFRRASQAMESREAADAAVVIEELNAQLRKGQPTPHIRKLWTSFSRLLEHRGFSASTPQEVCSSLREILDAGPGFDLFDLARAIARCDVTLMHCLKATSAREIPELTPFQPECDCGHR